MQIKRGEIWYIERGFSIGSEQASGRPAVVISNNLNNAHSSTVEVVYLTMDDIEAAIHISLGLRTGNDGGLDRLSPPVLESRLSKVEATCDLLRQMYDSLSDKTIRAIQ